MGEDVEKSNPFALLVGMETGSATIENSMNFPKKIKSRTIFLIQHFYLGDSQKKMKSVS